MDTPRPTEEAIARMERAAQWFLRWLGPKRVAPVSARQSAERLGKAGNPRLYERALLDYYKAPVDGRDGRVSMFIKAEKWRVEPGSQIKEPRPIQHRTPKYNVALGRFLHPVTDLVMGELRSDRGPLYTGNGLTRRQWGSLFHRLWVKRANPLALCVDLSRFDAHVALGHLRVEHGIYAALHSRASREMERLLRMQLVNRGQSRCGWRYVKKSGRMSGDVNTLLGNTTVVLVLLVAVAEQAGLLQDLDIVVTGDDAVVLGQAPAVRRFADMLGASAVEYGMDVRSSHVATDLERIEFCSGHPIETGPGVWDWLREFPKPLVLDQWSVAVVQSYEQARGVARAMALSAAIQYIRVPVYWALAARLLWESRNVAELVVDSDLRRTLEQIAPLAPGVDGNGCAYQVWALPLAVGRASFAITTGVRPSEQEELESRILEGVGAVFLPPAQVARLLGTA